MNSAVIPRQRSHRRENPPDERYRGTISLAPAFMRGEGHAVAGGVPRSGGESLLSHGFAVPASPEGKPRALRTVLAPRIYEGGGPRSGRGSSPAAAGKASSVTASPCQLPQRGSQGRCAPFLPPAFMRGEGHAVAGGVSPPQRGRPSQSRHSPWQVACGRPGRGSDMPLIMHSLPRLRFAYPRRGSQGRFALIW